MNLCIIFVGVGSGKIYCFIQEMIEFLEKDVCVSGIIVMIFINKAVVELQEWVCVSLFVKGCIVEVDQLSNVMIGIVYSLGVWLL